MRTARIFAAAVLLVLPDRVCFAAEQDPCDAGASFSDVQFALTLKGGQTQFREGEIIPLALSFSTASSRYWLNTASYDRSGRLGIDTYCVEPEGIDPLGDYFRMGFIGGGLFSNLHLIEKPFTHEAELNEWHRLRPGHYRLYVVSHRVSRSPEAGEASETGNIGLSISSNTVEFEVTSGGGGMGEAAGARCGCDAHCFGEARGDKTRGSGVALPWNARVLRRPWQRSSAETCRIRVSST